MTLGRVSVTANRQTRSSFSSSGEKQQPRSSFTSSGDKQQPRASNGSMDFPLSTSSFAQMAASPSTQPQQTNHQQQRSSICSRVSSLTRDSSSRSLDPSKIDISDLTHLFGRTREQELLQAAFDRVMKLDSQQKEVILIHGKAGTGKTSLMLDFKDSVTSTGTCYFCSGTFRQYQAVAAPYSGIVQALNNLCEVISAGPDRVQRRQSLYSSIGHDRLQEFSKLLPKLEVLLLGSYSDEEEDSGNENVWDRWKDNTQKLHTIFQELLQALCAPSHPIVFFLDNLQWADDASLNLISSLVSDVDSSSFMLIGAYRDRDDVTRHLTIACDTAGQNTTDIKLENLSLESVDDILSDLTGTSGVTADLANIVLEKTHGNPCSIFQFLEILQRKELLAFSFHTHKWAWDLELIKSKTKVSQNAGHVLVGNSEKLSREGKTMMNLAAIIGFSFDQQILEQLAMNFELLDAEFRVHMSNAMRCIIQDAVSGGLIHPDQMQEVMATQLEFVEDGSDASLRRCFYEETTQAVIQEAEVEGLIGKAVGSSQYKFSHDLVHQALYDITPPGLERDKLHLRIGQVMRAFYSAREDDEMLFAAVNHLNRGSAHLESDSERIELIQFNHKSSEKAKAKSALFSAADFSNKAIELLKAEHDWTNHYDLLLNIYSEAAKLNYACGRFDLSLRCCSEVHRHGRSLTDKLRASHIQIEILHSQGKFKEASRSCLTVLSDLGEVVNPRPTKGKVLIELRRTKTLLKGLSDDALLSLPQMVDPLKVDGMRFLSLLAMMTFHAMDDLMLPIVILRMMQNSIQNGSCEYTPFAFAGYGMMLTTVVGNSKEAFNYGSHAIKLCGLSKTDVCIPGVYLAVFSFLDHLRKPLLNGIEPLLKGYRIGIGNGEVQFAAPCMAASAALGFLCALPLKAYGDDLKNVCEQLKIMKQDMIWSLVAPYWQSTLNLIGEVREDETLSYGKVFAEKEFLNSMGLPKGDKGLPSHTYYMVSYIVAYIFNDFQLAHETRKEMRKRNNGGPKGLHFIVYLEVFFSGLLDFSRYRMTGKWKDYLRAKQAIRTLERYVKDGLINCYGMLLLLQAELESFGTYEGATKKLYDDAMKLFAAGGFLHFHAIANERAAEYMLKVGQQYGFGNYIRTSVRIYSNWGAFAKAQQLVEEHKLPSNLLAEPPPDARRFTPTGDLIEEEPISSDFM